LESKENALEKMRKERDELWAIVNTDKYKNFRSMEEEKLKFENKYKIVEKETQEIKIKLEDEQKNRNQAEIELNQVNY
jgi:hypothetical protein